MSKTFYKYGIIGLLAICLFACQQESLSEAAKGTLRISLTENTQVTETKATPEELKGNITGSFHVLVRNSAGSTAHDADLTIPADVQLPGGLYSITATYGTEQPVALDAPYYKGELSNVTITPGQTSPITVTCKVMNALISVVWSQKEQFDQLYSDYGVEVKVGSSTVKLTPDSQQSAYVQANANFSLTFVGTSKTSGQTVSTALTHTSIPQRLSEADHCKLTLLPTIDNRTLVEIKKVEAQKVTIQETIPAEWLPGPMVKAEAFDENNHLDFYETESVSAQFDFTLVSPLEELVFTVNFDEARYSDLNGEYTLSTLTPEQRSKLIEAGFLLPGIGMQAGACLSIDNFLNDQLASNEGDITHSLTISHLKANGRDIAEPLTYTITVKKPEFSISVDENNCWSREFTINEVAVQNGDANAIKSRLVYQYFDGTNWIDCQTRDAKKGRTQQFTEQAEALSKKSYPVRALYRGAITSTGNVTATLEEPTPIPNGDMEEWQLDNYQGSRYSFNPWAAGQSSGFWDTNNLFTTRHRTNSTSVTMANYNGMPAVSLVPGRSGLAAELRSTANGKANTRFLSSSHTEKDYNKVAGELYTGTAKVTTGNNDADASNDTHERIKDAQFSSRPSTLQFWYKYLPFDENEKFSVLVELYDKGGNLIASNSIENGANTGATWKMMQVPVNYTSNEKCSYLHILFCSTTVTGANMKYKECTYTLYRNLTDTYTYEPSYVGSVLTIDDIQLIYDK